MQGGNENAGVLVCLGVYSLLVKADVPLETLMVGLGVSVAAGLAWMIRRQRSWLHTDEWRAGANA